ncbi:hypothetical protein [Gordonia soli]|uniref:Uncharacterized protein n=1 Tax=Gordonia soli NBRC 108243 TaxID=1223545 RepID=M0QQY5_9ACTN|nr:hypothetical protein [Gordonia soli]GAC71090.1 hypothetical protein GS4_51_00280 [Gordonia soli NBRC 108243]
MTDTEPTRQHDPDLWPLAPGNAPAEIEAALRAEEERWPEPSADLRVRVSAVFRSAERRRKKASA